MISKKRKVINGMVERWVGFREMEWDLIRVYLILIRILSSKKRV